MSLRIGLFGTLLVGWGFLAGCGSVPPRPASAPNPPATYDQATGQQPPPSSPRLGVVQTPAVLPITACRRLGSRGQRAAAGCPEQRRRRRAADRHADDRKCRGAGVFAGHGPADGVHCPARCVQFTRPCAGSASGVAVASPRRPRRRRQTRPSRPTQIPISSCPTCRRT